MITTSDSLQFIKGKKDYEFNIIYADPPYALGSEIYIRPDGKVDYRKATDFMSKWEMPTGEYWEQWFKEAFRTLKYGGYLILFGIDRQTLLFKYYAALAGFIEKQSLYWYFISNFPKATDLSKMIDKQAGVDRETVGMGRSGKTAMMGGLTDTITNDGQFDLTAPSTDLAKKYDGYKYSIAPLKQTNETIMVFMKPTKTGSPLHDTLAYESGDDSINVSALDIDGNRVGTSDNLNGGGYDPLGKSTKDLSNASSFATKPMLKEFEQPNGRYPSQTFIDNEAAQVIDEQSGVSGGGGAIKPHQQETVKGTINFNKSVGNLAQYNLGFTGYDDIGGASKILHKCKFEQDDLTLYYYEPKVGIGERNAGFSGFSEKQYSHDGRDKPIENAYQRNESVARNNHPTLKPIDLNYRILKLFKTPNPQSILYPFAGSGSEIIGGIKAGFDNWVGCEINPEYVEIANARIKYWRENMYEQQSLFEEAI